MIGTQSEIGTYCAFQVDWLRTSGQSARWICEEMAKIYTMVGEYDEAIRILDHLLSVPSLTSCILLKKDPTWKPLWDLPAFTAIVEKYQLPDLNAQ